MTNLQLLMLCKDIELAGQSLVEYSESFRETLNEMTLSGPLIEQKRLQEFEERLPEIQHRLNLSKKRISRLGKAFRQEISS